jgi:hypothetical protein
MTPSTRKSALAIGEKQYFTGKPCIKGHVANRRAKTGECLACRAEFLVTWRSKNPQKVKEHNDTQYARHTDQLTARSRKFRLENLELARQKGREYQKKNLHIYAKNGAKRKAAKLQRTPSWLTEIDYERIGNEYKLACILTKVTGSAWHVDHIIPLQGKMVSGLHVPSNLRVLPAKDNISKSNTFAAL